MITQINWFIIFIYGNWSESKNLADNGNLLILSIIATQYFLLYLTKYFFSRNKLPCKVSHIFSLKVCLSIIIFLPTVIHIVYTSSQPIKFLSVREAKDLFYWVDLSFTYSLKYLTCTCPVVVSNDLRFGVHTVSYQLYYNYILISGLNSLFTGLIFISKNPNWDERRLNVFCHFQITALLSIK